MKKPVPEPIQKIAMKVLYRVPAHLSKNHIHIDNGSMSLIGKSIKEYLYKCKSDCPEEVYEEGLKEHLYKRLETDRARVIPWLDKAKSLNNLSILEIGCGTGSSTVALAEQGARVVGIDVDKDSLTVAEERCKLYGLEVEFKNLNATDLPDAFQGTRFDFIIYFACLEHMTIAERITSLKSAWEMLPAGGLLVIVETPNRLWYFDSHTSILPFFHWLPNELAFKYCCFSPREVFRELHKGYYESSKEKFLRRGRGVSFHEFDLAIKPAQDLKVVSSLSSFKGLAYKLHHSKLERRYKSFLRSLCPNIHEGFFDKKLDLIIEKGQ
jgi:2-polyprenyl-3-methyl-5-hydroxy-6-metoxy-1,4-benzoquinol methylase